MGKRIGIAAWVQQEADRIARRYAQPARDDSALLPQPAMPSPAGPGHMITPTVNLVINAGDAPSIQSGPDANRPVAGIRGRLYVATDTLLVYYDNGSTWDRLTGITLSEADARYLRLAGGTLTGRLTTSGGLHGGYSNVAGHASSPDNAPILKNLWLPREGTLDNLLMLDYQDALAYYDGLGATITLSPAPDYISTGHTASTLLHDDEAYCQWSTGSDPKTIVATFESKGYGIPDNGDLSNWVLGITFRSDAGVGCAPTHVKVEVYESTVWTWKTKVDEDVVGINGYGQWVSPNFAASGILYGVRVTITVPSPLSGNFRLQRIQLYHPTSEWDPWHLHVKGGDVYGPIRGFDAVRAADSVLSHNALSMTANAYADLGYMPELDGLRAFTLAFWAKFEGTTEGGQFFRKYKDNNTRITIGYTASPGTLAWYLCNGAPGYGSISGWRPPSGWFHMAFVFDGSGETNADRMKIYVNGVQQTLTFNYTVPTALPTMSTTTGLIGYSSQSWVGKIADYRIYGDALSAADVQALYQHGAEPAATPIHHFRLDEGAGTWIRDVGSNPRMARFAGTTWWSNLGYTGLGVRVPATRLSLPGGTTKQDGINWGNDVWLYRSAPGELTLEGVFQAAAGGAINADRLKGTGIDPTAPTDGQALVYDSTSDLWVPTTLSGGHNHVRANITDFAHKNTHATGGGDALAPADIGAAAAIHTHDRADITGFAHKNTHATGGVDALAPADIGAAEATHNHVRANITDFAHKNTHVTGGVDALTPADIGAAEAAHTHVRANITDFAHKTTHATGGVDALTPADIGAAAAIHNHVRANITDFAHKNTHATGGGDALTPADIGAAAAIHNHVRANITDFAHTHVRADITDFAHKNTHVTGGVDALTPADIGAAEATHDHGLVYAPSGHDHRRSGGMVTLTDLGVDWQYNYGWQPLVLSWVSTMTWKKGDGHFNPPTPPFYSIAGLEPGVYFVSAALRLNSSAEGSLSLAIVPTTETGTWLDTTQGLAMTALRIPASEVGYDTTIQASGLILIELDNRGFSNELRMYLFTHWTGYSATFHGGRLYWQRLGSL